MPLSHKTASFANRWVLALAAISASPLFAQVPDTKPAQPDIVGINAESFYGKEPTEGVYVRDSAGAVEKLALAQKMERLKEWNKSADLYQEVIVKYADRVVPSQLDKDKKIYQYTSITNPVQERLAHWPLEGLDVYRARFETPAQTLLDAARPEDAGTLNKVYSLYFVTEAGKQAGIRLIDLYLETGEYPAAAWIGDRLLNLHPGLQTERAMVLYRTALAYYYSGDQQKAHDRLAQLKARFGADRGMVRGKEVLLADSLDKEILAPVANSQSASADSWPMAWGDPSRSRISTAEGRPGARLYGIALSKPSWSSTPQQKDALQKQYDESIQEGQTLGILPVTDRGELFFQDGQRIYGISIESGVPLPAWTQTYTNGVFTLPGVWGSPRAQQLATTLTEHEVLAIMGQPDRQAALNNIQVSGEARIVCLDRQSGREKWTMALSQLPESAKEGRTLHLTGSPMVVGDNVLVMGRGQKTQFEDCYVMAFDLATGKHRWSTYIASASSGVVMWNGMGGQFQQGNDPSDLAYANGRVYVQTNLGALAALDAYTGAVAWLDIYPTGRQAMERQQFNPFIQQSQGQSPAHKPWAFNPVIVQDGYVFSLPTEGHNLLIYDAANGTEVKRIDVKDIEQKADHKDSNSFANLDTLVGVVGDNLLLAGDKAMIYLNWKNYTKDGFDPEHDNITIWPYIFPQPIRGRAFITKNSVFVPCLDRLYCVSLKLGKIIAEYPRHPASGVGGDWEEPEEPGNVLATNDHVVLAGARMVNVYTDLTLAKVKLDRELKELPSDPQPRLRYAEVMFVAGEPETAVVKLDEAAELLGGLKTMQPGQNRDRFFNDALTFADKLSKGQHDEDRDRAAKMYDRAGSAAYSPVQQVHYRLSRAKYVEGNKDYTAAVTLYQQILSDALLRPVPMANDSSTALQADAVAEKAIAALMKDHPAAYESFQQSAAAAMEQALASKADTASKLLEIARTYPNSTIAGKAMIAAGEAYESAGDSRHAVRVLRDLWFKYPDSSDKARILESIARNYLVMASAPRASISDHAPMDNMEAAAASLARAASSPGDPKLEKALKLRDGTVIAAGTSIASALDTVRKYRGEEAAKALPEFFIPVPLPHVSGEPRKPRPKPFLPPDKARDVLPNIKALVLPIRDFSRSDRVVVYTASGDLKILPAGELKPLATSQAIAAEPKACAWVGDHVLVWNGSQVVNIKGETGASAWSVDLHQMQPIEIVRVGDNAQNINPVVDPNVLIVNGGQQIRARPGQRVIFRPNRIGVVPNQPVAAIAHTVEGPEEIVEVRPVGDHVLITTTTGRILSVELTSGRVAWQTRLCDRPVDRIVANADFTVVRVSDDTAVRIAAFDTATGQMRCTRSWVVQSGMVPVNVALAADGTLVYTMPDRLCLKDLYKPWPDPTDKEVQGNPGLPLFDKANQPDQLLIAEGRILALADDGTIKYVRVHSLETGQPVPLRYHSAQGEQDIDRRLTAGKSDQVTLRVVGPHLYVVSPYGVISYNLDHPAETWENPRDEATDRPTVRDSFIGQKFLALLNEAITEDAGAPVPVGVAPPAPAPGNAPAPNVAPAPAQPAGAQPNPNGGVPAPQPVAPAPGPATEYTLQIFGRYPVSDKNPAESGRIDYLHTVTDPAGILPGWQAADGGFYYLTADSKLHILRGSVGQK